MPNVAVVEDSCADGALSMKQLNGLIAMFNGRFWRGLHPFNKVKKK